MKKQYLAIEDLNQTIKLSDFFDEIILIQDCESSNNLAKKLIQDNKHFRSGIIVVNKQTKGRGRQNKIWISEFGTCLTFSLVIDAKDIYLSNYLSLVSAKALHLALLEYENIRNSKHLLSIKWPNDIYAGEKKIAGILCENIYEKATLKKQIIGIGLNFSSEDFHTEELKHAGSIKTVYNFIPIIDNLFSRIVKSIDSCLKEEEFDYDYINKNSFLNGKKVQYTINGVQNIGSVVKVNNNGELLIQAKDNKIQAIHSGSIEVI